MTTRIRTRWWACLTLVATARCSDGHQSSSGESGMWADALGYSERPSQRGDSESSVHERFNTLGETVECTRQTEDDAPTWTLHRTNGTSSEPVTFEAVGECGDLDFPTLDAPGLVVAFESVLTDGHYRQVAAIMWVPETGVTKRIPIDDGYFGLVTHGGRPWLLHYRSGETALHCMGDVMFSERPCARGDVHFTGSSGVAAFAKGVAGAPSTITVVDGCAAVSVELPFGDATGLRSVHQLGGPSPHRVLVHVDGEPGTATPLYLIDVLSREVRFLFDVERVEDVVERETMTGREITLSVRLLGGTHRSWRLTDGHDIPTLLAKSGATMPAYAVNLTRFGEPLPFATY